MTLFKIRVLAYISRKMKMSSYWRRVDSKSIITTINGKFRHTHRDRGEEFVKVKAMD